MLKSPGKLRIFSLVSEEGFQGRIPADECRKSNSALLLDSQHPSPIGSHLRTLALTTENFSKKNRSF